MHPSEKYATWFRSRGKRLLPTSCPKHAPVHVILGSHLAQPFFGDVALAEAVHALVADHRRTFATCLMPDHLHWLLDDAAKMRRAVSSLKSYSTRVAWNLGHKGKLWQRSYWDRVVRVEEDLERVARYVVENPVREGLVEAWWQYPYSMSRVGRGGGGGDGAG